MGINELTEDRLRLTHPDYLDLLLTYQRIEDYLFQHAYAYMKGLKRTKPADLKAMEYQSMAELLTPFEWSVQAINKEKGYEPLYHRLSTASRRRNYYVHEFFGEIEIKHIDFATGSLADSFQEVDDALMDDMDEAQALYETLITRYGSHPYHKKRKLELSSHAISHTDASVETKDRKLTDENRREVIIDYYFELLRGYSIIESELFSAVSQIHAKYPFLEEKNEKNLHSFSYGEYRKVLTIGVKKNGYVKMIVDDGIKNLTQFLSGLNSLQNDRNYWIHFCLGQYTRDADNERFLASSDVANAAAKSYAVLSDMLDDVFDFVEKVSKRLGS